VTLGVAALLGLVAGAADTLPVSVATHLLLARAMLGLAPTPHLDVVIQLGTCAGIAIAYARRSEPPSRQERQKISSQSRSVAAVASWRFDSLAGMLLLSALPTLVFATLLAPYTQRLLFRPASLAIALVLGGVACLATTAKLGGSTALRDVSSRQAMLIGLIHPLCLWPGTSHVLVGWIAGRLAGLSARASFEFALLLSIFAIAPCCLVNAIGARGALSAADFVAMAAAAVGAVIVIRVVREIPRLFATLGAYRIALGIGLLVIA
jgi:undecaprenyl-diphosphatase